MAARPVSDRLRARTGQLLRRFTLGQVSTLLGALGIAFLVAVFTVVAVKDRVTLYDEARDHAQQTSVFLADHAQRLFEVADIVLHATTTSLGSLDWTTIAESGEVAATLRRLDELLPYVDAVFAADRDGVVAATSLDPKPPRYAMTDRSVFAEARKSDAGGLLIGEPIIGRVSHRPTFLIARRRDAADGSFDGIVGAAMSLAYFTDYWQTVDKRNDERIVLVRGQDGAVLARFPQFADDQAGEIGRSLVTALSKSEGGRPGLFSPGPHQYGSYHKVGALPVYIAVVYGDAVIQSRWLGTVRLMAVPAALALLAILGIMLLARRLARREERARQQMAEASEVLSSDKARLERHVTERTAELVESNKEMQRFAYVVSHDLRAPLVNIVGFAGELRTCIDEITGATGTGAGETALRLRPEIDEAFGFITSSTDKMDRLIDAILTLSRQGQRVFRPESLDMTALVRSAVDGVAHRIQLAGATVTVAPLPGIVADRIAVEQVFANLIDNAVKYLRAGVPGQIRIVGEVQGEVARFAVSDNGRGIAPHDRERVFELFRRAGRQDMPGEGIGLAHVRSLVRRLQGTIVVDGEEGVGCTFSVTLPLSAQPDN